MGSALPIEKRQRAERLYVVDGVTALTALEARTGISRPTLSKWKIEDAWEQKRSEYVATPDELADRLKKLVHRTIDEFDEKLKAKEFISPELVKQLESQVRTLYRIDGMFYSRGMMIQWMNAFVDFVAGLPKEGRMLKDLKRIAPLFIDHVEKV